MLRCSELIDTLWNVNCSAWIQAQAKQTELIDTLWNVNKPIVNPFLNKSAN